MHHHSVLLVQVPIVVAEAQAAIAAGQAVVIGLQTTGEAAADAMQLEPGQMCGFVSTTRELLSRFTSQHFPVRYEPGPNQPAGLSLGLSTLKALYCVAVSPSLTLCFSLCHFPCCTVFLQGSICCVMCSVAGMAACFMFAYIAL